MSNSKTSYLLLTEKERINDIVEVCEAFEALRASLNEFDRSFLKSIYKQKYISDKQANILNKIERKIFGIERELEENIGYNRPFTNLNIDEIL